MIEGKYKSPKQPKQDSCRGLEVIEGKYKSPDQPTRSLSRFLTYYCSLLGLLYCCFSFSALAGDCVLHLLQCPVLARKPIYWLSENRKTVWRPNRFRRNVKKNPRRMISNQGLSCCCCLMRSLLLW